MSVYKKWSSAMDNRDAEALIECLHEDYTFVRHQTGTTMNRAEMSEMLRGFMSNDAVVVHERHCLYENDEVLVERSVMNFPDGSRESVLGFNQLKDGKILRSETGATPIKSTG